MRPNIFDYTRPRNVEEAIALMRKFGGEAKILAGGQSLVPLMKLRLVEPSQVIDITSLKDLRYIRQNAEESCEIGALATHHDLEASEIIQRKVPSLYDAALVLGDPLVRNRGTLGGAICHADPAADYPAVLVSLNAEFFVRGPAGTRQIPSRNFFLDYFTTALMQYELLNLVKIPVLGCHEGAAYLKMERVVGDFAIVGAAAFVRLGQEDDILEEVRVVLSAVGNKPIVPTKMVEKLAKRKFEEKLVAEAAEEIRGTIDPPSDIRASSEYRKNMAVVYAKRALLDAVKRARGKNPVFVSQAQSLRAC